MTAQDIAKKLTFFANPIATSLYNAGMYILLYTHTACVYHKFYKTNKLRFR